MFVFKLTPANDNEGWSKETLGRIPALLFCQKYLNEN